MSPELKTYQKIIDYNNIRDGYFDIVKKFDEDSKGKRYYGIDGLKINDINYTSLEMIEVVQKELISFNTITPPYMVKIPKKNGKTRNIYGYSIKERVKAEAIYRVLEPIFDEYLSSYLFSYRKSHPYYFAARSVVRRYKRYFGYNHILVADLSDYTDSMDHEVLFKKLDLIKIDEDTKKIVKLFISSKKMEYGEIKNNDKGLMTGTPITGLLSNLFLDDFDKWAGKYVDLYRRVGDDMIAIDKNPDKISKVYEHLIKEVESTKLKINKNKVRLINDQIPFEFLGYRFENGSISFDPSSLKKIISEWKINLMRYPGKSINRKKRHLKSIFYSEENNLFNQFDQIIKQKILANDDIQIKKFSDQFYKMLTSYFYGHYSERNRRKLSIVLKDYQINSLYQHYNNIHFPQKYE